MKLREVYNVESGRSPRGERGLKYRKATPTSIQRLVAPLAGSEG